MYDFNNLNPLVGFLYFTFVIFFSMIFTQPLFALAGLLCSFLAVIFLVGKSALNRLKYFIPLSILIAFINPIFNTKGDSVLFYLFGKRPYTLEALVYGMVLACIFLCAVNWFLCYGKVISSDKFLYIFGNILPSACLIINMILRLIPFYHRKLVQIEKDRDCIGLGERGKFKTAFTNFSVLLTQGLEGSISTSDS
ncbi:MAG: energy-coupling factor transporter transmembrane component T, partial [Oscillospiraceae bacterium]